MGLSPGGKEEERDILPAAGAQWDWGWGSTLEYGGGRAWRAQSLHHLQGTWLGAFQLRSQLDCMPSLGWEADP